MQYGVPHSESIRRRNRLNPEANEAVVVLYSASVYIVTEIAFREAQC
jgi:hypothetical protein